MSSLTEENICATRSWLPSVDASSTTITSAGAVVNHRLHEDALRPWTRRSWIFPRHPDFATKAGRVLDLYHRRSKGRLLAEDEFVISADEKTQIPIRTGCHPLTPPAPGRPIRVEHEYRRHGVCAYLAAWDVHRARLFGHVVKKISIVAFDVFVAHVMAQEPYRSARRVFWIVDGGTIHRGQAAVDRLEGRFPNLTLVHLPKHASWLNQIEIYFSILQRKALTPADFPSHDAVAARILGFQNHYQQIAKPFEWKFTRHDLRRLLARSLASAQQELQAAA